MTSQKLPKAPQSSPEDARAPPRASRTLPTAPESAPEGAQPSLFRPPKTSPALQKPVFSLRKTSISNFGALPTICERAATDCTPPGGAPVTQPGLFGPQPPSPKLALATLFTTPCRFLLPTTSPFSTEPHTPDLGSADSNGLRPLPPTPKELFQLRSTGNVLRPCGFCKRGVQRPCVAF